MLDQSFSAQNLFYIYKHENNKGNNIASKFFPEIIDSHNKIKRLRRIIFRHHENKRNKTKEWFQKRTSNLYLLLKLLKKERNDLVVENLSVLSARISSKNFDFSVSKAGSLKKGKEVYLLDTNPEAYFAEKQIQRNIKYTYKVKQNDRDLIIPQLFGCLNNKYPVHIVRTDIKSFYESIDQSLLLSKLNENAILSLSSRKIIAKLLRSYCRCSGSKTGIPRGIGISAYLSELYLKDFDEKIRNLDNLVYYARYVDDIILIIAPENNHSEHHYLDIIRTLLEEEKLKLNTDDGKTSVYLSPKPHKNFEFDYLGYKFNKNGKNLILGIADKKRDKYISKIKFCINEYNRKRIREPRKAKNELYVRLKFLTSNTRLSNNKGNAVIGIYNNNKWVTEQKFLKVLDGHLNKALSDLNNVSIIPKLRKRFSFKSGFENRSFSKFTTKEFSIIGKGWEI